MASHCGVRSYSNSCKLSRSCSEYVKLRMDPAMPSPIKNLAY
eukprot:CAMPEP_0183460004 /NCGR_PEP_ID=MMETSP0370-20130417/136705_1 /TAXON_ID=268820 /ORGANISM="Peridinium aciculiferum, Strain PAER-2" /LENGTH=41 /DNA_ID= /DNA_START= /DNA_END= /DNA_ORIENTATION=